MDDLGECLIPVPIRVRVETAQRMDRDAKRFPFCEGRGAIGRKLIELAYEAIDAGILEFEPGTLQEVQSNLSALKKHREQSLQTTPSIQSIPAKRK